MPHLRHPASIQDSAHLHTKTLPVSTFRLHHHQHSLPCARRQIKRNGISRRIAHPADTALSKLHAPPPANADLPPQCDAKQHEPQALLLEQWRTQETALLAASGRGAEK